MVYPKKILGQGEPVVLMAVPSDELLQIKQMLMELLSATKGGYSVNLGDWIDEKEAQKLLGRKGTWFWHRRKNGELVFTKVGNKIMYSRESILNFLNQNAREEVRYA